MEVGKGYLVEFYLKDKKVHERICKSSSKLNAVNTAIRSVSNMFDLFFDSIKVNRVKLNYEVIDE